MASSTVGILVAIIAYLSMVICIGVFLSKRNKNVGDFYLPLKPLEYKLYRMLRPWKE